MLCEVVDDILYLSSSFKYFPVNFQSIINFSYSPSNGGKDCVGKIKEYQLCNSQVLELWSSPNNQNDKKITKYSLLSEPIKNTDGTNLISLCSIKNVLLEMCRDISTSVKYLFVLILSK